MTLTALRLNSCVVIFPASFRLVKFFTKPTN
jgi:hypothetical protein